MINKKKFIFFSDERKFYSYVHNLSFSKKYKFDLSSLHVFGFVLTERIQEEKGA